MSALLGSAIGFFLAWTSLAWITSAVGCGIVHLLSRRDAKPAWMRWASAAALTGPLLLATTITGSMALASLVGVDHCPEHLHHPHLCLLHGGAWAERPLASALAAGTAVLLIAMLVTRLYAAARTAILVRRLREHSTRVAGAWLVESDELLCFTAGIRRPEIFVSTAAWRALPDEPRTAMLAHERSHVLGRDPAWQGLLSVCAVAGLPFFADRLVQTWKGATERLCDAAAARKVGAVAVAEALVVMAKASRNRFVTAFGPAPSDLVERVRAVLDESAQPEAAVSSRAWIVVVPIVLLGAFVGFAETMHHFLESILGRL